MKLTQDNYLHKQTKFALDENDIKVLASSKDTMNKLGISFADGFAPQDGIALDAGITQPVTTPSNGVPVQFLQEFLPGVVNVLTTVRKADLIAPVVTAGEWHLEEYIQKIMEHTANPALYSEHGGLPLVSFNETYERRQIVRFEMGVQHTQLSDARSSATGTSPQNEKRIALAEGFEILRNDIAFNGFNVGTGRTYGLLNDPNLTPFVTVEAEAVSGNTKWSEVTTATIVSHLVSAFNSLEIQSGGNVDTSMNKTELTIPLGHLTYMTKSDTSFANGMTAMEWLSKNYPNCSVVTAPQFVGADAGENIFYLKAVTVDNSGTDGGEPMIQVVPMKLRATGSQIDAKGSTIEGYTSAYGGTFVKRAYAIGRFTGI